MEWDFSDLHTVVGFGIAMRLYACGQSKAGLGVKSMPGGGEQLRDFLVCLRVPGLVTVAAAQL